MKRWLKNNNLEVGSGIPPSEMPNSAELITFAETMAAAGVMVTLDKGYAEGGADKQLLPRGTGGATTGGGGGHNGGGAGAGGADADSMMHLDYAGELDAARMGYMRKRARADSGDGKDLMLMSDSSQSDSVPVMGIPKHLRPMPINTNPVDNGTGMEFGPNTKTALLHFLESVSSPAAYDGGTMSPSYHDDGSISITGSRDWHAFSPMAADVSTAASSSSAGIASATKSGGDDWLMRHNKRSRTVPQPKMRPRSLAAEDHALDADAGDDARLPMSRRMV